MLTRKENNVTNMQSTKATQDAMSQGIQIASLSGTTSLMKDSDKPSAPLENVRRYLSKFSLPDLVSSHTFLRYSSCNSSGLVFSAMSPSDSARRYVVLQRHPDRRVCCVIDREHPRPSVPASPDSTGVLHRPSFLFSNRFSAFLHILRQRLGGHIFLLSSRLLFRRTTDNRTSPFPQFVYRIGFSVHLAEDPTGTDSSSAFREWCIPFPAVLLPEVAALVG